MHKRLLRRRFVVDWDLQGSLCAHALLYGVCLLVFLSGAIFVPLLWELGGAPLNAHGLEDQAIVMVYMHERFWGMALLCFVLLALGSIRLSHRIAGPMVRFKRNLRWLAEGKLPAPLRTRDRDYLKAEVECLNQAVAGVRERVEAIRAAQGAMRRELAAVLDGQPKAVAAAFDQVLVAQRDLETVLQGFEEQACVDTLPAAEQARTGVLLAFAGRSAGGD